MIFTRYLIIALSVFIVACSSQPKKIDSPLFDSQGTSFSENENVVTIPQDKSFDIIENKKKQDLVSKQEQNFITYIAKGGEQLSFVARSLLGDPHKTDRLMEWNAQLQEGPLQKRQSILVKVEELNPIAIYLSKDLIEQNLEILGKSLRGFEKVNSYRVSHGDTLQKISSRFYSTTRNWTLLYLFNIQSIKNPDKLETGIMLQVPSLKVNPQPRSESE